MFTAYRIKHIPTGLFYCPYRMVKANFSDYQTKTNLSKVGKIYPKKPTLKFIGEGYYSHFSPHTLVPFVETEWEIVEAC
jgi:hypothetical protein